MKEETCFFLSCCGISFENIEDLDGTIIDRDFLLSSQLYENVKPKINEMRKIFSSSTMTSMQKQAQQKQRWPLLNLVRQILRVNNFKMKPIRKSNGSDELGKKLYKRFFKLQKIKKDDIIDE